MADVTGPLARPPSIAEPRVLVAQLGARRHYLVPVMFHRRGLLEQFITDLYVPGGRRERALRGMSSVIPVGGLRRLAGRSDIGLPSQIVTTFSTFGLEYKLRTTLATRRGRVTEAWLWAGREFGRRVTHLDWGRAQAVYAYSSAALEIFETAKQQGRLCVLDHATAPKRFEDALTARQAARYEGWARNPPRPDALVDEFADRQNRETELADVIICGSTFVKNAVEAESGQGHKAVVVPLGMRSLPTGVSPKPAINGRPLRILFVGDEAIRKGIGDLCRAVELFGTQRCEVRVAGNIDLSDFGRQQASRTADLLGPVPRQEMRRQYEWADVCLLPSVSDTFGLVILEAMSLGVPVITTPNTGGADVIADGENGFIVPVMSPEDIAAKLDTLDAERGLLAEFSRKAIARSSEFNLQRYGDDLIAAVQTAYAQRVN
ncbi:MAG: glycosyltransferase family 4 protein [Planctomycetaceae bacterium]